MDISIFLAAALGSTIAVCGPQQGTAYYPNAGVIAKKDSGWSKDGISKGQTTLVRASDGSLDVVFRDASGQTVSSKKDGAEILEIRRTAGEIAVGVFYPQVVEIYSFLRQSDGKAVMMQLQSRGLGQPIDIPKSAVYVADCSVFNP